MEEKQDQLITMVTNLTNTVRSLDMQMADLKRGLEQTKKRQEDIYNTLRNIERSVR